MRGRKATGPRHSDSRVAEGSENQLNNPAQVAFHAWAGFFVRDGSGTGTGFEDVKFGA